MMLLPKRLVFLGYPVDRLDIRMALAWISQSVAERQPRQIVVVNANKLYLATHNPALHEILLTADLAIPEWAIVWGARQLGLPPLMHVGGIMLVQAFMPYAAKHGLRPYLLGAKPEVVSALAKKLQADYPDLKIAGFHDGYLTTPEIEADVVDNIRQVKPDVLFVAIGSPKQEFWIHAHHKMLGVPVSIGVGGSFDVMAGLKADVPAWMRGRGLEWVYRIAQDPRAYWKRYLITNTWFVWQVMKTYWVRTRLHGPA